MDRIQIGRYAIKGEIGRGGMATVFHAHDPRFDRDVAVKILPIALTHDPQFRTRFDREAKTIGLLEHPAIVPVYDFGEEEGLPYIVMRLMTGGSLSERLEEGPLSVQEAEKIVARIGQALDIAHSKGIIHRDLKPGNILFDQYGNAFLSDFGIARLAESGSTLTGSQIIGTPAYMSPEQIQGDRQIDGRSDIYALGIILFHMLTKDMPFKADTPAKLMMAHVLDPVPSISKIRPGLPEGVDLVIEKAMQKDPDDRYPTGAALANDYSAVVKGLSIAIASTRSALPIPSVEEATIRTDLDELKASETVVSSPAPAPPVARSPRKKKSTPWLLYAGLAIVFLAAAGALAFAGARVLSGGTGANASPTPVSAVIDSATSEPTQEAEPSATQAVVVIEAPSATLVPTEAPTATEEPTPGPTATPAPPVAGGADMIALIIGDDVWVANLDGANLVQLTNDGIRKFNLKWLPDRQTVAYISGGCIQTVTLSGDQDYIACFEIAQFFEGFDITRDGSKIAISLNRELFIVNYDLVALQAARFRTHLIALAPCEFFAPYTRGTNVAAKSLEFSDDGDRIAVLRIAAGATGLQEDQVDIVDISKCVEKPVIQDGFPATRFTIDNYNITPRLPSWDWDGQVLFLMNSLIRNNAFGDLYLYNPELLRGDKINPVDGSCCYYAPEWSPDGRYVFFAFQDIALGSDSITVFYYVPFATLNSGGQLVPMNFDPITNPKEITEAALRPAAAP